MGRKKRITRFNRMFLFIIGLVLVAAAVVISFAVETDLRVVNLMLLFAALIVFAIGLALAYLLKPTTARKAQQLKTQPEEIVSNPWAWIYYRDKDMLVYSKDYLISLGYDPSQFMQEGKMKLEETWIHLLHPDDKESSARVFYDFLNGNSEDIYENFFRIRHQDGRWLWICSRGKSLRNPDGSLSNLIVGTHIDITDRIMAEEALNRQNLLQTQVAEISSRLVKVTPESFDQEIQSVLASLGELFHMDRAYIFLFSPDHSEMSNTHEWCAPGISREQGSDQHVPTASISWWYSQIREGQSIHIPKVVQLPLEAKGEREIFHRQKIQSLVSVPMVNQDGVIGFLGFDSVRKERHWSENDIAHFQVIANILADAHAKVIAEKALRESKEEAELATKVKSEFLANMSHEIRTPMNAVLGLSQRLMQTSLDTEQQDLLRKIHNASKMLLDIINDILDYSKIEAGKVILEEQPFCIESLLEQMKDIFSITAKEKRIDLICQLLPAISPDSIQFPWLIGDVFRLGQVLTNLLSNAIKFTEEGHVELKIIRIDQGEFHTHLRFEVTDTGIGMESHTLDKLFQAFSQGDTTTTRKYGGTGLGLVICSQLVKQMGGELQVTSIPGKGSTFFFELHFPIATGLVPDLGIEIPINPSDISSPIGTPKRIPSFKGKHILLVEDNALNQEVALWMLSRTDVSVTVASNGVEAIEAVKKHDFDLILIDLQMPVMDGFEATRHIRSISPTVPVIALSAAVTQEDRERVLESGMNAHVGKPIDASVLYDTLSQWLSLLDTGWVEKESSHPQVTSETSSWLKKPLMGFDLEQGLIIASRNENLYSSLLHGFREQLSTDFASLGEQLGQPIDDACARSVHTLKGLCSMLGAVDLESVVMEIDSKIQDRSEVPMTLRDQLTQTMEETLQQLNTIPPLPAVSSQNAVNIPGSVKRLYELLTAGKLFDPHLLAQVVVFFEGDPDDLRPIRFKGLVERFEYREALSILKVLAQEKGVCLE